MTSPKHPHSVHLAVGLIEQDFREGSALPAAAPRMLADVLWDAANKYLSWTYRDQPGTDCFSCNAVGLTFGRGRRFVLNRAAESFLLSLGCNPDTSMQLPAISGFENGDDRLQGVRYMWLLLAMHVAEDEGLTA